MDNKRRNLLLLAFVISIFLHSATALRVYFWELPSKSDQSIEVVIIDSNKANRANQVVEQSEKRVNDEIDEKAKYLSRFNQKIVQETKAAENGKFQNDAKQGLAPKTETMKAVTLNKPEPALKESTKNKSKFSDSLNGLPKLSALRPQFEWNKPQVGVNDPGLKSQTDDHLKDVQVGAQTMLSSREFVYYSYYSRIKERLRMFWEPKIKEKVRRIFLSGRKIASSEERLTRLVITLDKDGKLIRVQVLNESGLKDLDDAAIEAFQSAAPFPNPPTGIVESDGTIRIRWDFILEA